MTINTLIMKKALLLLLLLFSATSFVGLRAQVSPGCQQGLQLWYAADTGVTFTGSGVTAWADRETKTQTYNLTNTTGVTATLPAHNASQLNGHPTIGFDNNNEDQLYHTSVLASDYKAIAYMSCYMVLNASTGGQVFQHGTGSNRVIFMTDQTRWGGNGADNTVSFTNSVGSSYEVKSWLVSSQFIPPFNQIYQISTNGVVDDDETQGASSNVATATDSFVVGARHPNRSSFAGEIAEIMVYKSEHYLATATKASIETYLALKYGISKNTSGNPTYRNKDGVTLWDYNTDCGNGAYSTFSNRITGIFRDNCFGTLEFNKSTNSVGTSTAVLTGALTDNGGTFANPNSFQADFQAFLWGDNGGTLSFANASDAPTGFTRLNRVWKVDETLNSSTIGQITFEIDLSGSDINAGTNSSDVIIIIDRNNDGDFTDAGDETINLSSWNGTSRIGQFSADFDDCETFSMAVRSTALPVTWSKFNLEAGDDRVNVVWGTSTEINNSHFEVQRSTDGNTWNTLATRSGQGTTHDNTEYSFVDYTPEVGVNYYRIKQVDFSGVESYTVVESVNFMGYFSLEKTSIFPNPSNGNTVSVELPYNKGRVAVSIVDITGNELSTDIIDGASGQLNTENLSEGLYFVKMQKGNASKVVRMIVN